MPHKDPLDFRPPQESRSAWKLLLAVLVLAIAAGWWFWWRPAHAPAPAAEPAAQAPEPTPPEAPSNAGAVTPLATEPSPEASGPQNPVDALGSPDSALPSVSESDQRVKKALGNLLGQGGLADLIEFNHFVRRAVATLDNLGRSYAPDNMWPVRPTPERFTVTGAIGAQTIAPDNAARYDAFVAFAQGIPLGPAVKLYAELYPLFQSAYVDLGYPHGYFNDRLVAVLDLLIATPIPTGPIAVQTVQLKSENPSAQPWVHYEYVDPALESLSSGQKILIRMGPENERKMKAVLTDLRRRVATGAFAQPKNAR
ncbi:MAG: DUF3014 domain-containing protein [Burkholderiaceae bacterium]|jgi:hypothetical protein|nr:MAG: DUF3014 domain-containing protein [Burkholderiaceae bacterium]